MNARFEAYSSDLIERDSEGPTSLAFDEQQPASHFNAGGGAERAEPFGLDVHAGNNRRARCLEEETPRSGDRHEAERS